jgi:hypothetical protein
VHTASVVATVAVHTASAAAAAAAAVVVARCILQFVALRTTLIGVVVLVGVVAVVVAVAVVDFDPVVVDCTTVGAAASYRFHPRRSSFVSRQFRRRHTL